MKIYRFLKVVVLTGIIVCWFSGSRASEKNRFFAAGDPAFQYMGRVEIQNDQARYNWPGVTVSVDFSGELLGIRIKGGPRNYFNVWVDDFPAEVFRAVNDTVWWFSKRLSPGEHRLRLVKRTEADMGMAQFYGIHVGKKDSVKRPAPLPERKILFIGNSITCGYGTEGKNKSERFLAATENCEKSYASILARAFGAQYQLTSHSGLGMVRNYGDPGKTAVERKPMPARLEYLFDNDSTKQYDLRNFVPDVVFVNLGTNDFSTQPFPDEADFIQAGERLITKILKTFPGVKVFCITGPMINEPCFSYTKKMVESVRNEMNTKDIVFVGVPVDLLNTETDLGSDWHPSYRGQIKTANLIIPVVGTVLNWEYSSGEIDNILTN
ncbi:SGNH/GDSL hydrolase family protein [Gaoshiqia sp. Z1-71]|uniref:SGNH/GDSL hydrolase family protein n=1 Tax=Gaoshiqia hydrogeniformans TaxID=3290090 RepID=UPI003BF8F2AE